MLRYLAIALTSWNSHRCSPSSLPFDLSDVATTHRLLPSCARNHALVHQTLPTVQWALFKWLCNRLIGKMKKKKLLDSTQTIGLVWDEPDRTDMRNMQTRQFKYTWIRTRCEPGNWVRSNNIDHQSQSAPAVLNAAILNLQFQTYTCHIAPLFVNLVM